jgi:hypothetical protein
LTFLAKIKSTVSSHPAWFTVLISQACFRIVSIKYSTFILIKELSETNTKGRKYSLAGSQFARSLVFGFLKEFLLDF